MNVIDDNFAKNQLSNIISGIHLKTQVINEKTQEVDQSDVLEMPIAGM